LHCLPVSFNKMKQEDIIHILLLSPLLLTSPSL
jgi:hypothetical protein